MRSMAAVTMRPGIYKDTLITHIALGVIIAADLDHLPYSKPQRSLLYSLLRILQFHL